MKSLILLFLISGFAQAFEILPTGCYKGTDHKGNDIQGQVLRYSNENPEEQFLSLGLNGKHINFTEISFYNKQLNSKFLDYVIKNGNMINSRHINSTITYQLRTIIERYIMGEYIGALSSDLTIAVKESGIENYEVKASKKSNYSLFQDRYYGASESNYISYKVKRVTCL